MAVGVGPLGDRGNGKSAIPQLTDHGNAERLVSRHGGDLRCVPAWGKWLVWDGRRWAIDDVREVLRRAKDTVRSIYLETAKAKKAEMREAIAKHAIRSEANGRILTSPNPPKC